VGAVICSPRRPAIQNDARERIVAQEMAGGDPAAEMTGRPAG